MEYLSEILKIIDCGVNGQKELTSDYALLLADKLKKDGKIKESDMVRNRALNDKSELKIYPQTSNN